MPSTSKEIQISVCYVLHLIIIYIVKPERGQEEKQAAEDEMIGWHLRFNGHEFAPTLEDGEGQGSLVCSGPWGHKETDMTE